VRNIVKKDISPVMKEMNSDTHSCMISFDSLEILALEGRADFMIREMLAMGRNLHSNRELPFLLTLFFVHLIITS
jgi:hypothetical protein